LGSALALTFSAALRELISLAYPRLANVARVGRRRKRKESNSMKNKSKMCQHDIFFTFLKKAFDSASGCPL
jgi:hypothetical protein